MRHGKIRQDHLGIELVKLPSVLGSCFNPAKVASNGGAPEFPHLEFSISRNVFDDQYPEARAHWSVPCNFKSRNSRKPVSQSPTNTPLVILDASTATGNMATSLSTFDIIR